LQWIEATSVPDERGHPSQRGAANDGLLSRPHPGNELFFKVLERDVNVEHDV
jgi:hypothetical protein